MTLNTDDRLLNQTETIGRTIGEYGSIDDLNHNWQTISLDHNYDNPVVIVSDLTYNGTDVATVRLKNVDGNSFQLRIQDALHQGADHLLETASYLVVEAGNWRLSDGTRISAGQILQDASQFQTVGLSEFDQTPTLLTQVQTFNRNDDDENEWVITRTKNITANSFELTMQEAEEFKNGTIAEQTIGWLAIDQKFGNDGDTVLQGGLTEPIHTDTLEKVTFQEPFLETPIVLAKLGSYFESDPANIRIEIESIDESGFDAKVHEDTSKDEETTHEGEQIAFLALGDSEGLLTGININDVNEDPTDLDLDNKTIDENVPPNSLVGTFSTTDPDSGDSFTYTLVTGDGDTDNSAFTINGDQLKINDSPDYETKSSYNIRVQTTDGEGASYQEELTININDVNEDPTDLDLNNKNINENVPPNSLVGTFSTTDPDSGDSFTYTLVTGDGDTDNSAFTINGDQLKINDSPDYETKSSYNIRVQTTDGEGASYQEELTINVNDVNENSSPTDLDLDNKTIDENVPPNSLVGTFSTTDPDSGDSFTYTLVTGDGDTDNSAFTINGDQLKINDSPDYETKSSYNIRVQTTDGEGASYQEELTINVNDVNEDVIEGTPGRDRFRGSNTAENYSVLAGNDRVYGNGGDDTIDGGEGNDIIYGGNDDDLLNGGLGGDRLYGDDGNDQLLGQDGNDILYGGAGDDILNGGPGNDRYNGGAGTDTLIIAPGMGLDMIQGFEDGTDTIKLEGGIGFADLDIVSSGSSTLIKLTASQETLARISGIDVSLVGEADFTV